jgi:proline iminopeptidase
LKGDIFNCERKISKTYKMLIQEENMPIQTTPGEELNDMLGASCVEIMEALKPLVINVSGSYDSSKSLLSIKAKAVDNEEINNIHLRLFYTPLFYIQVEQGIKKYNFDLITYTDPTHKEVKHHYHLETSLDVLPDTGGITREEWKKFTEQLVYILNEEKMHLSEPAPFIFENSGVKDMNNPETVEGYVEVTGGKVWYKIAGVNKKGIPLLVLHGGPGCPHDYLTNLEILSDERPVIFYDQLGCGNSDIPDDTSLWTRDRFVEELEKVREELHLEKCHILGQSWGSMLAVDYMLKKKPDGVVSLILSAPVMSCSRFVEDQRVYVDKLPSEIREVILKCEAEGDYKSTEYYDAMMEYYKIHVCRIDPWPECLKNGNEKIGYDVYEYMWGPSEFTMTGILKDFELLDNLKDVKEPILLTCGRYDEATPEATALFDSKFPNSEMVIFEDASHDHHLEKPEEYFRTVRDFIKKIETVS